MKLLASISLTFAVASSSPTLQVNPILEFPEVGLDDSIAYRTYTTRFYKDSRGNALQVYINKASGRVVHLWADGANESIGFTMRQANGSPANISWRGSQAEVFSTDDTRHLFHELSVDDSAIEIGWILLNSMRVERDFHYAGRDLLPFGDEPAFRLTEVEELINHLSLLPEEERRRHLAAVACTSVDELNQRLYPKGNVKREGSHSILALEQRTLDGRNRLRLELQTDSRHCSMTHSPGNLALRSTDGSPITLRVHISSDSPSLTPLTREQIFNKDFFDYYQRLKKESAGGDAKALTAFRQLDRQVRGMELVSYKEKLMAGLPNFATYFGRDMMMSALMMEDIWKPEMLEHVVGSVLRKLAPGGEVSHEEALGWQAIRENAAEYSSLLERYLTHKPGADSALESSYSIIQDLQAVRENYVMVDDDFQLPVLAARYLARSDVPAEAKRSFLEAPVRKGATAPRLTALLQNLARIAALAHQYVVHRNPIHLVGFPRLDDEHWWPGSWRDSRAGYANGRFAMDINVIWVPNALEGIGTILATLRSLGYGSEALSKPVPDASGRRLLTYLRSQDSLLADVHVWRGARRHFEVTLTQDEVRERVKKRIEWLPRNEREYWKGLIDSTNATRTGLTFLALALDENGRPIPVMHTDFFTRTFLEKSTESIRSDILMQLNELLRPYPVGVLVDGLGPLVANDTYASQQAWETFRADRYHSPYVVWGREVNLLQLGLAKHILAEKGDGAEEGLRRFLRRTVAAVEASGLKHNELWSYRIEGGMLLPERYATTSDIQLWNLTDLAVQYMIERVSGQ